MHIKMHEKAETRTRKEENTNLDLLSALPADKRDRLAFLINRGGNPKALDDLLAALSAVSKDPDLSVEYSGDRWNLRVFWDKSPIGKIPLIEIEPNESYGHSNWQSVFSNAKYFVRLDRPDILGYSFEGIDDIRNLTAGALRAQKEKAAAKISKMAAELEKGCGKDGRMAWKVHSPVTNLHYESVARIRAHEKVETVSGNVSAPVYAYIGESGSGKDRRIKLEGNTILDKLVSLYKAGTYTSIGPAEGSREWNKLDDEDRQLYKKDQEKAKKLRTFKEMGDFLSKKCSDNESFLFAIRQGDDAVWVNPKALKELLDTEWHGVDKYWIEDACGVWDYHHKEFLKWKKRFGQESVAESMNGSPDFTGPAYFRITPEDGANGFHCDTNDDDEIIGWACIREDRLKSILMRNLPVKLGKALSDFRWRELIRQINGPDLPVGDIEGNKWSSGSQGFEDPGDGEYVASLILNEKDVAGTTEYALFVFVKLVLELLSGKHSYALYSSAYRDEMLDKARMDKDLQRTLDRLGINFDSMIAALDGQGAYLYAAIWRMDTKKYRF